MSRNLTAFFNTLLGDNDLGKSLRELKSRDIFNKLVQRAGEAIEGTNMHDVTTAGRDLWLKPTAVKTALATPAVLPTVVTHVAASSGGAAPSGLAAAAAAAPYVPTTAAGTAPGDLTSSNCGGVHKTSMCRQEDGAMATYYVACMRWGHETDKTDKCKPPREQTAAGPARGTNAAAAGPAGTPRAAAPRQVGVLSAAMRAMTIAMLVVVGGGVSSVPVALVTDLETPPNVVYYSASSNIANETT
jgi:hypothetical protein